MGSPDYQEALEQAYFGQLSRVEEEYFQVPTVLFVGRVDLGMAPPPEIDFYELGKDGLVGLVRHADEPYSPLALSMRDAILIKESDLRQIQDYAENQMLSSKNSGGMGTEQRLDALRRVAIRSVDQIFEDPSEENIKKGQKVVGSFVFLLMREPRAFLALSRLSSHDPYTLQHSVGTAVNSIILARKAGVTDERLLNEAGLAGLLHDVGKIEVPTEIINKPGPLNDREWRQMQEHSSLGFEIVRKQEGLSDRIKLAILEHHEDRGGTGYPNGLDWNEIGTLSKVVGICDIFNALTTDRSYAVARTPFDALQLMQASLAGKMDLELFKKLVMIYGGKLEDIE